MIDYNEAVEWCEKHKKAREEYNEDMKRLKDAIQHCEDKILELKIDNCYACAKEHERLLDWLKELLMCRER